jgi:hypothetical protein
MATRDNDTNRTSRRPKATDALNGVTADVLEQRVVAFAEQLGRIAGTVQTKAEGWMDRESLNRHLSSIRDGAADLLRQLTQGTGLKNRSTGTSSGERSARRSRGPVDAPGKKHRKRVPNRPKIKNTRGQAAKPRKPNGQRRGRG